MPRAPKHCGKHDCLNLVTGVPFCPEHAHGWGKGNPRTKTPEHIAWRAEILKRDRGACQLRYQGVCIGRATIADHILATKFGGAPLDLANGQAACKPCSDRKSSDEGHIALGHNIRPRNTT